MKHLTQPTQKLVAAFCAGALISGTLLAGCSASSGADSSAADASQGGQSEATQEQTDQSGTSGDSEKLTPESHLFQTMGQLYDITTPDEANAVIGFEGEKGDESTTDMSTSVSYTWDMGNDTSITGRFYTYTSGSTAGRTTANYEADYRPSQVGEAIEFTSWDAIEAQADSAEGITYDQVVEMLGGVPGLLDEVHASSSGSSSVYMWYGEGGRGYLTVNVDADGKCGMMSAYF